MTDAVRILIATPYGEGGMGGIDRLNDAIIDGTSSHPEFNIVCQRLVTRGKGGLFAAQFIFALALLKFCLASILARIDLLHIHLSVRGSSYRKSILARTARLMRVPYVLHLHGTNYREFWAATHPFIGSAIDLMFLHSAKIIVLGNFWADVVCERLPEARNKIAILPNATAIPTAPRLENCASNHVRITFLGQLGSRKGSADLLQSLANSKHREDWSATLAGDGAIAEARAQASGLGLQSRVLIPGWLGINERADLLCATDILVLPSYAENLPMVLLEAFAHGIPVITTPVGAIPEVVIPERNGLLVTPGDVAALTAAIDRLMSDGDLRMRMGNAAREDHATYFELSRYLVRLSEIWRGATV